MEAVIEASQQQEVIPLNDFIREFGEGLLSAVQQQNPPIYDGVPDLGRTGLMEGLLRKPFPPQQEVVQAVARLLVDEAQSSAIINAEMGTGKVRRIGA